MEFLLSEQRNNIINIGKLGKLERDDLNRLLDKILLKDLNKIECWIWTGTIQDNKKGHCHGCFWYNRHYVQTHRIMYHNYIEDVPIFNKNNKNNQLVLHKCSHKNDGKCVNPWHMKLGTFKENTNDSLKDNTLNVFKTNELHPMTKISNDDVIKIRSLKGKGLTQAEIAKMFNISPSQVSRYWSNKIRKIID